MPQHAAPAVLITRPAPGEAATARAVAAVGWRPVLAPALLLAPLPPRAPPPRAQALLLTSAAAVRALGRSIALPVLAVGEATAAAARAAGFTDVTAAGGDALALAALVAARCDPSAGPLWLAVGRGYGTDLATDLRARGFRVIRRTIYAARPAPSLPGTARAALGAGEVLAALFTSPRGARSMVRLLRRAGLGPAAGRIAAIAISPRVAEALAGVAWRELRVASMPTEASLLDALGPIPGAHPEARMERMLR